MLRSRAPDGSTTAWIELREWRRRYAASLEAERELSKRLIAARAAAPGHWQPGKGAAKHGRESRAASSVRLLQRRIDDLRRERGPAPPDSLTFTAPDAEDTGDAILLEAAGIAVRGRVTQPSDPPVRLGARGRLLLRGANGAGKSTLLEVATSQAPALSPTERRAGRCRIRGCRQSERQSRRATRRGRPPGRRAAIANGITAVQGEYSLWTRDPEDEVPAALRELGIGLVAYSPLGRGFLTGQIRSLGDLPEDDWRRSHPRFREDALQDNRQLADRVTELANERGVAPAQLALAWVLAKGDDITPIPGTKSPQRLEENAAAADVTLSAEEVEQLENAISRDAIRGSRYPEKMMALLNN